MRAADRRSSSSSILLHLSSGPGSAGFRAVVNLTCSRIGSVGSGLIDDRAIDVLRGVGASDFDIFDALGPLLVGCGSSGSSRTRFRQEGCSPRRLEAASFRVFNQASRFSAAPENKHVSDMNENIDDTK